MIGTLTSVAVGALTDGLVTGSGNVFIAAAKGAVQGVVAASAGYGVSCAISGSTWNWTTFEQSAIIYGIMGGLSGAQKYDLTSRTVPKRSAGVTQGQAGAAQEALPPGANNSARMKALENAYDLDPATNFVNVKMDTFQMGFTDPQTFYIQAGLMLGGAAFKLIMVPTMWDIAANKWWDEKCGESHSRFCGN